MCLGPGLPVYIVRTCYSVLMEKLPLGSTVFRPFRVQLLSVPHVQDLPEGFAVACLKHQHGRVHLPVYSAEATPVVGHISVLSAGPDIF